MSSVKTAEVLHPAVLPNTAHPLLTQQIKRCQGRLRAASDVPCCIPRSLASTSFQLVYRSFWADQQTAILSNAQAAAVHHAICRLRSTQQSQTTLICLPCHWTVLSLFVTRVTFEARCLLCRWTSHGVLRPAGHTIHTSHPKVKSRCALDACDCQLYREGGGGRGEGQGSPLP